ncbi:hypothetical protein N8Z26_07275 [Burkholderiales bacterium]|nr:hypothetical protein [Burkholderiales bacterium]
MSIQALSEKIRNLQSNWPDNWIGMRDIFKSCHERLGFISPFDRGSERVSRLIAAGLSVANFVEHSNKKMARNNREPNYHSRLHTAIVLESLTALLLEQRRIDKTTTKSPLREEILLLVAMAGHDAGHDGSRNSSVCQLESRSFRLISPLLEAAKCDPEDIYAVKRIIWGTDPMLYEKLHKGAQTTKFSLNHPAWQAVICQESDILASAMPEFEKELTQSLANEWQKRDPISAEGLMSRGGRTYFLTHYAKFSSPAALSFGLPELVDDQLSNLQ